MLLSVQLALIAVHTALSDTTPVLMFPLNKQYGGRAISEEFPRIKEDDLFYLDGPSGCKDGAIAFKTWNIALNISDKKLLLNESFSIFMYGLTIPGFQYSFNFIANKQTVLSLSIHYNTLSVNGATRNADMITHGWMHIGLSLNAKSGMAIVWINGAAITIDISNRYNPNDAVSEIRLLDTDYRIAKKASCLAIYDHVTKGDEVKSIIEGCKACKVNNSISAQCKHDDKDRENCGYNGIGKQNCLRRKCCWDKSQERGKHCFYEKGAVKNDCYNIPKARRVKCGQSGIGKIDCQQLNCCFDETVLNAIKCFVKPASKWSD